MTVSCTVNGQQSMSSPLIKSEVALDSMVLGMQAQRETHRSGSYSPASFKEVVTPVSFWDSFSNMRNLDASGHSWQTPLTSEFDSTMDIGLYNPKK